MGSWVESLVPETGRAYLVALRATGEPGLAEEAVQEAYLRLLRASAPEPPPEQRLACWLGTVHGAAVNMVKSSVARRRREEEHAMVAGPTTSRPDELAASAEMARAARVALVALPLEMRQAISLCCEQELTRREAAGILGVPERTVSEWVARGLERLRSALTAGGFAACAPAALGSALGSLGIPPAPAGLAAKLGALAASAAEAKVSGFAGAKAATTASATKGGLAMKIVLGVVLAGALAGGVALLAGPPTVHRLSPADLSSPPAAKGGPLVKEHFAFVLPGGYLNGPRKETMAHRGGFSPVEADAKGNVYGVGVLGGTLIRCIRADGQTETITGDDFTMANFKLTEGPASALGTPPEGFTFGLAAPTGLMVQGVPAEGEGKGHLLLIMKNQVFRLWKNAEKGNRWWFKQIVGGGKTKLPQVRGQSVPALEAGFELYGVQWDKDNKLILWADAGSGYRYDGEKLTCILSRADYADKVLKDSKGQQPLARQFFLAADGAVYLGYYFSSDEAYAGKVPAIWRLSPDGSKAEPFAKNSAAKTYDGDALAGAHFFCGPHFGSNSVFNPPDIFITRAHDENTARRIKNGRTSRLCWDGEWREVSGELDKQLILLPGLTRGGPDAVFGSGVSSAGNPREDYRMYVIKGIDFGKPTVKEGGK